eukprot:TRINITY_DN12082_c0_g1_i1.p1 TRINITY_DN12082_c0_g1~~TRINITY_DN12082_c0_g1_i1.p1  ORF type:complete len:155 (-),score=25.06 TRINITY_DN12082_c0_g1_i1:89-553(-)
MIKQKPLKSNEVQFGTEIINAAQTFIMRKNVLAFVPPRQVTPGHVIVCPRRLLRRLSDLNEIETIELWATAQEVSKVLESIHRTEVVITVTDGEDAGQMVDHAHIHILPKQRGGEIKLESYGAVRSETEAFEEASKYRAHFEQNPLYAESKSFV